MKEFTEITKEVFKCLVSAESKCIKVINKELFSKYFYFEKGVEILVLENKSSFSKQYFITDINF